MNASTELIIGAARRHADAAARLNFRAHEAAAAEEAAQFAQAALRADPGQALLEQRVAAAQRALLVRRAALALAERDEAHARSLLPSEADLELLQAELDRLRSARS